VFNAAMDHDDLTTVDSLLKLGLDPSKSFWTDGYVAPTSGPFSGYKRGEGPRVDSPLIYTMVRDKIDVFNLMQTHGLPLTRPTSFERKTLLILAVEWNAKKIAKYVLGECDLLSVRDQHGLTPLHHAANSKDDLELEELLIATGADVNAQSNDGWTPLHLAVTNWATDSVALLLKSGANVSLRTARGDTVLDKAPSAAIAEMIRNYEG
jgi:ankyrin repeat protein